MLSTLLYFFSPRILIDSLHNNKDIIFMSLIIIMLYYAFQLIKEKKFKYAILFGIASAFVCNVKVLGLLFLALCGLAYILNLCLNKEWNKHNFLCGLIAAITSSLLYVVLTPAI